MSLSGPVALAVDASQRADGAPMKRALAAALRVTRGQGWHELSMSLPVLRDTARSLGWEEVRFRPQDAIVSELRPAERSRARKFSMSAAYGRSQQPLHTDGAHLHVPPDLVVLCAAAPSSTPTRLYWVDCRFRPEETLDALQHGVFLVEHVRNAFLTTATSSRGLRFDPVCMRPCDARAQLVASLFESAISQAHPHRWADPDRLLLIDNRWTLHGRAAIAAGDDDRLLRRVAFRTGGGRS